MTYAFVQDIPSSWERYQHLIAALTEPPPDGMILHVAGPTDEGFRIIAVWESERAWRQFESDCLHPAMAALAEPNHLRPTFRDLEAIHVVVGRPGLRTTPSFTP